MNQKQIADLCERPDQSDSRILWDGHYLVLKSKIDCQKEEDAAPDKIIMITFSKNDSKSLF